MTPIPTSALVPRFHPDRLIGDPQAWMAAMDGLARQVQMVGEDAVTAVAAPTAWLEAHGGVLSGALKSGRLTAWPWLLWPAPWGLERGALVRLGVAETGPFPFTWRDCAPSATRWIDVTCPNEELDWAVRPVQSDIVGVASDESSGWAGPVRRIAATLLEIEHDPLVQQAWQRLRSWLDGVDAPWSSPAARRESLDALWASVQRFSRVPVPKVQNPSTVRADHGKAVVEGGTFRLEISEGGRVDLVRLFDGKRHSRFLEYRLEGPTAITFSRGQPHRIAVPEDGGELRLRVRLPQPGKGHGLRDPLKLWTALTPDGQGGLSIQTRFENLPQGHRLVLVLNAGFAIPASLNRGPWGDVAVSHGRKEDWTPCGTVARVEKNGSALSLKTLDWQGYRPEANGRLALSHVYGESGTLCCRLAWTENET